MHDAEQGNGDERELPKEDVAPRSQNSGDWLTPDRARDKLLELNPQIGAIPDDMTHAQIMQMIDATLRGEY